MKKSLLALAALASVAGAAQAQSSVTLSGSVDLGIRRVPETNAGNGQREMGWNMGPAASGRSAITFSGREDLGSGMYAFFLANHRFDASDGSVNSASGFWRQSWVGLGGGFGDVRLGKMLPPLQEFNGQYEPWDGGDTVGNVHTGGPVAGFTNARYNSTAYYRSPSFGGFQIHASVSDGTDNTPLGFVGEAKKPVGIGAQFATGPLSVALAYDRSAIEAKTLGLYGKYNFGVATALAQYERNDTGKDTAKDTRYSIGALVPVGPATIKAGFLRVINKDNVAATVKTRKLGLGVDYNLSKRTRLYSDIGKTSGDNVGDVDKKVQFDAGIQHRF